MYWVNNFIVRLLAVRGPRECGVVTSGGLTTRDIAFYGMDGWPSLWECDICPSALLVGAVRAGTPKPACCDRLSTVRAWARWHGLSLTNLYASRYCRAGEEAARGSDRRWHYLIHGFVLSVSAARYSYFHWRSTCTATGVQTCDASSGRNRHAFRLWDRAARTNHWWVSCDVNANRP